MEQGQFINDTQDWMEGDQFTWSLGFSTLIKARCDDATHRFFRVSWEFDITGTAGDSSDDADVAGDTQGRIQNFAISVEAANVPGGTAEPPEDVHNSAVNNGTLDRDPLRRLEQTSP